jgi:phage gpG-like protein
MSGIEIRIDLNELKKLGGDLQGISDRAQDFTIPMKVISTVLVTSIAENFQAGGRPDPWQELSDATLLAKAPKTAPLIDSGDLFDSIRGDSGPDFASASTDRIYARIQQLGGTIDQMVDVPAHERMISQAFGKPLDKPRKVQVRAHERHMHVEIPARPFMVVQDEDLETFGKAIVDYLMGE